MRQEKHLVVGADGLIGGALAAALRSSGHDVVATSRRTGAACRLDLEAADCPQWTPPAGCAVAYLCAAVTSLKACDERAAEARRVNVLGTLSAARALVDRGVFVVFLSTNLVFDGARPCAKAADDRSPVTEYGRQKAEAEAGIGSLGHVAIVRLTKVVPAGMPLLRSWRDTLRRQEPIHPFNDKVLAPISLPYVVGGLQAIGRGRGAGIWQLSADRDISYAEAATMIAERVGVPSSLVVPVSCRDGHPALDCGPRHTTLDGSRATLELGLVPEDVTQVVCAGAEL